MLLQLKNSLNLQRYVAINFVLFISLGSSCCRQVRSKRCVYSEIGYRCSDGDLKEVGGALVTPETHTAEQKKMVGSVLIIEAESLDEVRKMVESDIYYTSNVVRSRLSTIFECEYGSFLNSSVGQGETCHFPFGSCSPSVIREDGHQL